MVEVEYKMDLTPKIIENEMYEAASRYTRGKARHYLGMSQIGAKCGRALWYAFRGFTPTPCAGQLKMIFSLGDKVEDEIVKWLTMAGYNVTDRQHEFLELNGFFKGHWDGLIEGGVIENPCVLEIKSMNSANFISTGKQGIKKAKPIYYCQVQCYMHYAKLSRALFVVMNKDNCAIYTEFIDYDFNMFKIIENRAIQIISSKDPPQGLPKDDFSCCNCSFGSLCLDGTAPQTEKTCGTCEFIRPYLENGIPAFGCAKHRKKITKWGSFCEDWEYIYKK